MILGQVKGSVVATQKHERLGHNRILIVQPVDPEGVPVGASLLALDRVDAGEGDRVLVNKEGGGARIVFRDPETPVQAVIVAVVDRVDRTAG